jgi:hypothetical protein
MYKACCLILLASVGFNGQTARDGDSAGYVTVPATPQAIEHLHATLMALKYARAPSDSLSQQLADSMMALTLDQRQPSRSEVAEFTGEFTRALVGSGFNNDQAAALQQCLVDLLRGEGITNYELAQRLRGTLAELRVDDVKTEMIIRRFLVIGEAVRGPDDSPALPKVIPKQK